MKKEGVIVGCDNQQEWLLPWWWKHYAAHNEYPVLFVNFGMSEEGKAWCSQRGECVPLSPLEIREKEVSPSKRARWEKRFGKELWSNRWAWFKKPFACLQSPFPLSLWIDLDCQVRKPLEPLFHCLELGVEIAVKRQPRDVEELNLSQRETFSGEKSYNGGVIAFRRDAPILETWIEEVKMRNGDYISDQEALARVIFLHRPRCLDLPPIYNWNPLHELQNDVAILHFFGGFLKECLLRYRHLPEEELLLLAQRGTGYLDEMLRKNLDRGEGNS